MKKPLNWIPLWIDAWLFGSTRIELNLEQRAVWVDLLALAGKDSGFIRANEGVPYPPGQLAGLLGLAEALLTKAIDRFIETEKLKRFPDGTLYITNWETYKLTPQYRRRLKPPSQTLPQRKLKESRGEESKGKGNTVSPPRNTVSEKGNTKDKEDDLPPIPKNLAFNVQDQLRDLKASIRQKERLLKNPLEMDTKDKLRRQISDLKEQYLMALKDYE